ncbi:MAG: hypothetical protein DRP00_06360 [Candidatus Aenigmatarchaeota archaeon]|nr:MAG: hypothetical protein DRP00_06360 [Candidatus Aenigmarchaeota archaeon]
MFSNKVLIKVLNIFPEKVTKKKKSRRVSKRKIKLQLLGSPANRTNPHFFRASSSRVARKDLLPHHLNLFVRIF